MRPLAALLPLCFVVAACGTINFVVTDGGRDSASHPADAAFDATRADSQSNPPPDGSRSDSESADARATDAHPGDARSTDGPTHDGPAIDARLNADARADAGVDAGGPVITVDQTTTCAPATGTPACPYPTILAGMAAAATMGNVPLTVHVVGKSGGLKYVETNAVVVPANVTLHGDGPAITALSASGNSAMCGSTPCAVVLQGELDGLAVTSPTGNGIVTLAPTASGPIPTVRNASVSGSGINGVCALGSVDLGPDIAVNLNTQAGVESPGAGGCGPAVTAGVVHVIAGVNTFDRNGGNGIDLSGAATLTFEGGTASGDVQGIRLSSSPPGAHSIVNLTATGNTGPGAVVTYGGQSLSLRGSDLRGNTTVGLLHNYAGASVLDLGVSVAGGNTFGGATSSANNGRAGVILCNSGATSSVTAQGDSWSKCPPSAALAIGSCAIGSLAYADVVYFPAGAAGDPVTDDSSCTKGN